MKRRLISWINTKMFFKLVGFQEPRASMSTGSCGRFLFDVDSHFGRFATPSARTKPPGRAAQKLVRRPNKRTRQRASETTDLRTALPCH